MSVDSILIQHNTVYQIWPDTPKPKVPELATALLAKIVEAPAGTVKHGYVWNGTSFHAPPPPLIDALAERLASARFKLETGGISWQGRPIATDRAALTGLNHEAQAAGMGLRAGPEPWKCADGSFIVLENKDVRDLLSAARDHVRACFMAEAAVRASIDERRVTTLEEIPAALRQAYDLNARAPKQST